MSNEQLAISNDSQPRKMKYTGIIWCPSIPADWKMCRIKDCFFISKVNEAMGYYGAIYILSAFFSFAIQIYTNILPKVVFNEKEYFGKKKIQK